MKLDFDILPENSVENLFGGKGTVYSKGGGDAHNVIMLLRLPAGSSVGIHSHPDDAEVNYVISGKASFTIDGREEVLGPGECHYCPKGSTHDTVNCGDGDLVLFTVIPKE